MENVDSDLVQALNTIKSELGEKTKREERKLSEMLKGRDVSEVINIMMCSGNTYNRRILRFFRWFSKWLPIAIMVTHWLGLLNFSNSNRATLVLEKNNQLCDCWAYFMMYLLPFVIMLASRFFFLCWKYRIPFIYFFGVNAIHVCYLSMVTTKEMIMAHVVIIAMTCITYLYALVDSFMNTKIGRKIF